MPQGLIRKGVWALVALAILAGITVAALPSIASTQIVRNRIAQELSAWTGYRVEFAAAPTIEVWPFRAILSGVKFSDWEDDGRRPVIEADRIEISLSILAALSGNADLTDARFLRPIIHVTPSGGLIYEPDFPKIGRIANSIGIARRAIEVNPGQPDLASLPSDAFGTVDFVDGQVVVDRASGQEAVMTGLGGSLSWPVLNRAATVSATAIWRGESVTFNAELGQPLMLFAGGASPLTVSVKSAPLTADFKGAANLSANAFFDGTMSVASPSLKRTLEWSASDVVATSATGSFSLAGHALGDARRVKIEDAELALDGNTGNGLLDFVFETTLPMVAGTLAFENLDLGGFLLAFTPLAPGAGDMPVTLNPKSVGGLELDLRLSSQRAAIGSVPLTDVAATLTTKGSVTDFDLSDAAAFGGRLQAGLLYDRARDGGYIEMSLMATDLDAGVLAGMASAAALVPAGRFGVSTTLKGPGVDWNSFMATAEGSVSASFGPGTVTGIDLNRFVERVQQGGFFPLSELQGGTLQVDRADFKALVGKGFARIDKADVTTPDRIIRLIGIVPQVGRGLALAGSVLPKVQPADQAPDPLARFFVGGSWSAPFISTVTNAPAAAGPTAD